MGRKFKTTMKEGDLTSVWISIRKNFDKSFSYTANIEFEKDGEKLNKGFKEKDYPALMEEIEKFLG